MAPVVPAPWIAPMDGDLGDRLSLEIDPTWPYARHWKHPLGRKLAFTFTEVEQGFSEQATPNYGDTEVLGRAEMYKTYSGTANKEIPITFRFAAQGLQTENVAEACRREVVLPARFLDALKYPLYDEDSGFSHAPPPCLLRVGTLLFARVVLTQADLQWMTPLEPESMLPMAATVAASFAVVRRVDPYLRYSFDGRFQ